MLVVQISLQWNELHHTLETLSKYFSWWNMKHNTKLYAHILKNSCFIGNDTHASAYSFAVAMETVDNIPEVHALVHTLTTDSLNQKSVIF